MKNGTGILELIADGLIETLDALTCEDRAGAQDAFARVRPALAGRDLEGAFDELLASDQPVRRIHGRFYASGGLVDATAPSDAWAFVADAFPGDPPLVLLRERMGGARHLSELADVSVVELSRAEACDRETMVHELVHARVRSGHRMLDEGLAELMGAIAAYGPDKARAKLARRAQGGPELAVLAARRWTDQPCFEGLDAPRGSPHAVAALSVAHLIDTRGMDEVLEIMAQVGRDRTEDVRDLVIVPGERTVVSCEEVDSLSLPPSAGDMADIRRRFRAGDTEGASESLPVIRRLHLERPDDAAVEEAYILTLLLAANEPDAAALRKEFDHALERYVAQRDDTPLAYALCVSREGLNIRYASDFIMMNESFERGRAIIDASLDEFERDIDVLATAAKFELHTPLEYGGNPARARTYLQRAAAVTDDPELLRVFRSVLEAGAKQVPA